MSLGFHPEHYTYHSLQCVSSKEEALKLMSEFIHWKAFIKKVAKDVRHHWVVEPLLIGTANPGTIRVKARLKSGPVTCTFKMKDLDDYSERIFQKACIDMLIKKHLMKSAEVCNCLVFASHRFASWGLEDPKKNHNRNKRYKPDPLKFSDFWFETVMRDLEVEVGHSAVEMMNDIIGLVQRTIQNPKKVIDKQEAIISDIKRSITRLTIALSDHGVEVEEVVDFIRYNYVNKVISQ